MSESEGYVKYQCNWIRSAPLSTQDLLDINACRDKLFRLGLIGAYANGIGFGNLSIRLGQSNQFIISGTQTGHLPSLNEQHYTRVIEVDFSQNVVTCEGPIQASSESMTHAVFYMINKDINAVIHVHCPYLWGNLINTFPTSQSIVSYGTTEMTKEVVRLYKERDLKEKKMMVMSGHKDGIIAFGKDLCEAKRVIIGHYKEYLREADHILHDPRLLTHGLPSSTVC